MSLDLYIYIYNLAFELKYPIYTYIYYLSTIIAACYHRHVPVDL